jgi:hypothetical protein
MLSVARRREILGDGEIEAMYNLKSVSGSLYVFSGEGANG